MGDTRVSTSCPRSTNCFNIVSIRQNSDHQYLYSTSNQSCVYQPQRFPKSFSRAAIVTCSVASWLGTWPLKPESPGCLGSCVRQFLSLSDLHTCMFNRSCFTGSLWKVQQVNTHTGTMEADIDKVFRAHWPLPPCRPRN